MQDAAELVALYLETFNETDRDRRQRLLKQLYTPDCSYTDPHVALVGPEQISGFIEQTQGRFPGFTFTLGSPIDAHHDQARFQWHAGPSDKPDAYVGFDVILVSEGRIRSVYGFSDVTPDA